MTIKQKDAVVSAVAEVLGDDFTPGTTIVRDVITTDQKAEVRDAVVNGILDGSIAYSKDNTNATEVKKYVGGLINNHFRKAKDLNGGTTYKPTGTGPVRDKQLRELNKLLNTGKFSEGSEQFTSIQSAIATRTAELTAAKTAKQAASAKSKVDMSVLPENITDLLND